MTASAVVEAVVCEVPPVVEPKLDAPPDPPLDAPPMSVPPLDAPPLVDPVVEVVTLWVPAVRSSCPVVLIAPPPEYELEGVPPCVVAGVVPAPPAGVELSVPPNGSLAVAVLPPEVVLLSVDPPFASGQSRNVTRQLGNRVNVAKNSKLDAVYPCVTAQAPLDSLIRRLRGLLERPASTRSISMKGVLAESSAS